MFRERTAARLRPVKSAQLTLSDPIETFANGQHLKSGCSKKALISLWTFGPLLFDLLGLRPRKASGAARPPLSFRLCFGLRGVLRTLKLTTRTRYTKFEIALFYNISVKSGVNSK